MMGLGVARYSFMNFNILAVQKVFFGSPLLQMRRKMLTDHRLGTVITR